MLSSRCLRLPPVHGAGCSSSATPRLPGTLTSSGCARPGTSQARRIAAGTWKGGAKPELEKQDRTEAGAAGSQEQTFAHGWRAIAPFSSASSPDGARCGLCAGNGGADSGSAMSGAARLFLPPFSLFQPSAREKKRAAGAQRVHLLGCCRLSLRSSPKPTWRGAGSGAPFLCALFSVLSQ